MIQYYGELSEKQLIILTAIVSKSYALSNMMPVPVNIDFLCFRVLVLFERNVDSVMEIYGKTSG